MIKIEKVNESYIRINSDDRSILNHVQSHFTFDVPGAKFMPAYKSGSWDGKIRLFDLRKRQIYSGLLEKVKTFLDENDYEYACEIERPEEVFSKENLRDFIKSLQITSGEKSIEVRDFQFEGVYNAINQKRCLNLISTGGGKSLVMYIIARYMLQQQKSVLIIVPTVNLVTQLKKDFEDYSSTTNFNNQENVYCISGGKEKDNSFPVTISTWQSIYKLGSNWFNCFDMIICDEVHLATSACITKIFEESTDVSYRIGLTGTLRESKTNALVLEGLFGKIHELTSTSKMIEDGHLNELRIRAIILNYNKDVKKITGKMNYDEEINYIVGNHQRNKFIQRLALNCKGPTLVIFNFVEKHGKVLYEMIKAEAGDRPVFMLSGSSKDEERELAKEMAKSEDVIICGSYALLSTGTNIPTLTAIIFAHPRKSKVSILQSIGRVLRKSEGKSHSIVYDIGDDLSDGKGKNLTFKHFKERLKYYSEGQLKYKIVEYNIK